MKANVLFSVSEQSTRKKWTPYVRRCGLLLQQDMDSEVLACLWPVPVTDFLAAFYDDPFPQTYERGMEK
ncbi:MAG: hypothetical protein K6A68_14640 [Clostridiales bacterium]|nr:hypothetical protein [Clostridiales bacterium]